jgi:hypothetical protein
VQHIDEALLIPLDGVHEVLRLLFVHQRKKITINDVKLKILNFAEEIKNFPSP